MSKTNNGAKGGGSYTAKAKLRWGTPPDWIVTLAQNADAEVAKGGNLSSLGKRTGMEASLVSGLIGKTYPGKMDRHEQTVRGKLMGAEVQCPALGVAIGRDQCIANQQRKQFSASSPSLIALKKACPGCPNNVGAKQ